MKLTIEDGRKELYQWDTNRKLVIEDDINVDYLHFEDLSTDEGLAYKVIVKEKDGKRYGDIPNICLANGSTKLVVYAIYADEEGVSTITKTIFPIRRRQKPSDYELTDDNIVTVESILEKSQKAQKASEDARDLSEDYMNSAEIYKDLASKYAEEAEDVEVETGKYSSKHWNIKTQKKFEEVKEYVGSSSEPTSALGSIETARVKAINDVGTKKDNSITEIDTHVTEVAVPAIDEYVDKTANPEVLRYGKEQVDSYISGTSKPELDRYVNSDKKTVLDQYTENEKKKVLDQYTEEKKGELDSYTNTDKKKVLDDYVNNVKKVELNTYTNDKKSELDVYKTSKADELDEHTVSLKGSLDGYTTAKKEEISVYTEQKKAEISKVYSGDLNSVIAMVNALGLSVVNGELCVTYNE